MPFSTVEFLIGLFCKAKKIRNCVQLFLKLVVVNLNKRLNFIVNMEFFLNFKFNRWIRRSRIQAKF